MRLVVSRLRCERCSLVAKHLMPSQLLSVLSGLNLISQLSVVLCQAEGRYQARPGRSALCLELELEPHQPLHSRLYYIEARSNDSTLTRNPGRTAQLRGGILTSSDTLGGGGGPPTNHSRPGLSPTNQSGGSAEMCLKCSNCSNQFSH